MIFEIRVHGVFLLFHFVSVLSITNHEKQEKIEYTTKYQNGGGGWRGYSTNVYMLIRGGSAPRSNSLHFYKPFFYVKGNPFVYLLLTNGISFTDLISNFASLLTSHQASQQTNSGHVCDQPGLPVPEASFIWYFWM